MEKAPLQRKIVTTKRINEPKPHSMKDSTVTAPVKTAAVLASNDGILIALW